MLASRLLSILLLLQARGRMSASALAEEFEVSVRTIHRDIDQLSAAGIPVYAERGRNGGFRLMDGYRTKLTGMTQGEAEALFLAGLPGPAAELGLSEVLSAAQLKLLTALPDRIQTRAERIASRFHLDPAGWFHGSAPLPCLQTVAQAVWSARYLTLSYRNSGAVYDRKLGPLGLVLKGGVWYLIAQSGKSIRTYRVAQMSDAQVTDEAFERPERFDLAEHWQRSAKAYEAQTLRLCADVRLSPEGMARLGALGSQVRAEALRTAGDPDHEGWIRCSLPIEPGEYGLRELMRLGAEMEILGPAPLRAQMAEALAAMQRRYAAPGLPRPRLPAKRSP